MSHNIVYSGKTHTTGGRDGASLSSEGELDVVAGLPAGPHKILIEIATPEHRVIAGQAVTFLAPSISAKGDSGH